MKVRRSRILVAVAALVVAGSGCWRSGDVTAFTEAASGNEGGAKKMDSSTKDATAHNEVGTARDGAMTDGHAHHMHDASADDGQARDAAMEAAHDATTDAMTDAEGGARTDAHRDAESDAEHDATTDAGHDAGMGMDAGDAKDAGGGCSASTSSTPCPGGCCDTTQDKCVPGGMECVTLQAGAAAPSTTQCASDCVQCAAPGGASAGMPSARTTRRPTTRIFAAMSALSGPPTMCTFGCDGLTGLCADFVPANGAAATASLAQGDAFSCLPGKQIANPVNYDSIKTGPLDTLNITVGSMKPYGSIIWLSTAPGAPSSTTLTAAWGSPVTPAAGTPFIVAHVKQLSLAGTAVNIYSPYAIVFLVDDDVSITGSTALNLQATNYASGGSGAVASAYPSGIGVPATPGGCGGGGHGVQGGAGGAAPGASGGSGGKLYVTGAPFVLAAGSSGGGDSDDGKGGGALQISACGDISFDATVLINVSGGGGGGGTIGGATQHVSGHGGGSGGSIILEGATVGGTTVTGALYTLFGQLVANGGGGGLGAASTSTNTINGMDWSPTLGVNTPAAGGALPATGGSGIVGGAGGAGGAGRTGPGYGADTTLTGAGGGGGGGAYGTISIGVSPAAPSPPYASSPSPTPFYSHVCTTVNGVAPTCSYASLP